MSGKIVFVYGQFTTRLTSPAVGVVSERNVRRLERIDERKGRLDGSSQAVAVDSLDCNERESKTRD